MFDPKEPVKGDAPKEPGHHVPGHNEPGAPAK
jgi:hypothetical protein